MPNNQTQKNIPNGWQQAKLEKFCDISAGGTPSTKKLEYWNGNIPWMNSGDLNKRIIFNVEGRITEQGLNSSSAKLVPINSVLIGLAGQGKTRGTVAINKIGLTTNQSVAFFIPTKINYNFLYFNLYRRYEELRQISAGDGGRGGLNLRLLKNLKIILPPLPEQKRIVKVLETWDEAIEKLEKKIGIKKNIKKGLMQRLLTSKVRLPGFRDPWGRIEFDDCIIVNKKIKGIKKADYLESGEYPIIDQSQAKIAGHSNDRNLINNDLPAIVFGDHTRVLKYVDYPFVLGDDGTKVFKARNKMSIKFLYYYLTLIKIPNTGYNRHFKYLKDLILNIPSIKEQDLIVKLLSAADQEIEVLENKINKFKDQKKYLLNNLLTGKIRVPEFVK